ncbi:MAG: hypothetical protein ACE5IA_04585, partial [Dehalococcoidia bacterium]
GQIDVGWSGWPTNAGLLAEGKIRQIYYPSLDLPGWKTLIVGNNLALSKLVKEKPEAVRGFNRAWARARDFTYTNTKESFVILSSFSKTSMKSDVVIGQMEEYNPKWANYQGIAGTLDKAMAAAVAGKFIERSLTKAEVDKLYALDYIADK